MLTFSSFASWASSLSSSTPRLQCQLAGKGRQKGGVPNPQVKEPQGKWRHEVGVWARGYLCPGRSRRRPAAACPMDLARRRFWKRMQFQIDFYSWDWESSFLYIRLEGPEDPDLRNSSFGGQVTALTLQYLLPRLPGVWLGGPGLLQAGAQRAVIAVDP